MIINIIFFVLLAISLIYNYKAIVEDTNDCMKYMITSIVFLAISLIVLFIVPLLVGGTV